MRPQAVEKEKNKKKRKKIFKSAVSKAKLRRLPTIVGHLNRRETAQSTDRASSPRRISRSIHATRTHILRSHSAIRCLIIISVTARSSRVTSRVSAHSICTVLHLQLNLHICGTSIRRESLKSLPYLTLMNRRVNRDTRAGLHQCSYLFLSNDRSTLSTYIAELFNVVRKFSDVFRISFIRNKFYSRSYLNLFISIHLFHVVSEYTEKVLSQNYYIIFPV